MHSFCKSQINNLTPSSDPTPTPTPSSNPNPTPTPTPSGNLTLTPTGNLTLTPTPSGNLPPTPTPFATTVFDDFLGPRSTQDDVELLRSVFQKGDQSMNQLQDFQRRNFVQQLAAENGSSLNFVRYFSGELGEGFLEGGSSSGAVLPNDLAQMQTEQDRIKGDVANHLNNIFLPPLNNVLGEPQPISELQKEEYCTDNFRMYGFKIKMCTNEQEHDWMECPFGHPGEKACRRDPRKYNYVGTACPDFRKGFCKRGDACGYAHGVFECWLHPSRYRTQLCQSGVVCNRKVCFFAHNLKEIRAPIHQPFKGQSSLENMSNMSNMHALNNYLQANNGNNIVQNEVQNNIKMQKLCQLFQLIQQLNLSWGGECMEYPQRNFAGQQNFLQQNSNNNFQNSNNNNLQNLLPLLQSLNGSQQIGYSWGDGFNENGPAVEYVRQM